MLQHLCFGYHTLLGHISMKVVNNKACTLLGISKNLETPNSNQINSKFGVLQILNHYIDFNFDPPTKCECKCK